MLSRLKQDGITWVDIEAPTREEIVKVAEEFALDDTIAEELLLPSSRPHSELRGTYIYLILHFPALRHSHQSRDQEIDFIIGKNFLITTHYETIDPLHKFRKIFEVNSVLEKGGIGDHAGYLFYFMMKKLYKAIEHEVEFIRSELEHIEQHIFSGHEARMVEHISRSSRDLLNLRQIIEPHRDMLHDLESDGPKLFGEEYTSYVKALSNEYYRVHNHIMRNTEALRELRETNDSLLSTKQNETMRMLTAIALITFPLSLIVSVLDSHLAGNPLNQHPGGFISMLFLILIAASGMVWYFRRKRWL